MKYNNEEPIVSGILILTLPGPSRKRQKSLYTCRVTHREPVANTAGCVISWEVNGGRFAYQVSLERQEDGGLRWHCTCADAVYRGSENPHHQCKHIRGINGSVPTTALPVNFAPAA